MSFNNGRERVRLENRWKKLRVQYRAAGMSEEAIQAMYEFDVRVLNSERAYIDNTVADFTSNDDDMSTSINFKQYEDAITITDTYHETKTRFSWVGEIQNEQLQIRLEKLSDDDLALLTWYAIDGFTEHEIAKAFNLSQPAIHKRIAKIALFLKKF